jgi:outer membrane protein assembly complex protein YaeT
MRGTDGVTGASSPGWWKLVVLAGLLALPLLAARAGLAQTPSGRKVIVADVIPIGNHNIPTQRIMGLLKTLPGKEYNYNTVQEDVAQLAKLHLFRDIQVRDETTTDGRVIVYFMLTEFPNLVNDVIYRHAHHINNKDLDSLTGIKKGEPLNPTRNKQGCQAIEARYREQGRLWATVTLEEGGSPGDTRVVYNICEGPIVRVRSINFTGNDTLANQPRLRTQVDSSRAFLGMPLGGVYVPPMADHDSVKVAEYYKNNGYLDVRVSRQLAFSDDGQWVDLTYHIHEGQKYKVKDVSIEPAAGSDLRFVQRDKLQDILKLHAGDKYSESTVESDVKNITDYYGYRGYGVTTHKELFYPEPGVVQVRYEIQEKPPAKVGEVIIIGNTVTKDRVIRRVIPLYSGQPLSYPLVRQAEADLTRLAIFETDAEKGQRPTVTVLDSDNEYHNVLVQVQETHTGSLMFGIGVNSDAGLVGSVVLNEKNFDILRPPTSLEDILEGRAFRGGGQEFRIEAVPGTQLQRYTVSWREPFLFDSPYSLGLNGYYYQRSYNEDVETREGGRITVGHQFNRYWSASAGLRIENVNIGSLEPWAPFDYQSVEGNNFLVGPSLGVTFDSRDSFLKPTTGVLVSGKAEYVFGDFTFPVLNLEGNKYTTVWQRPDGSGKQVLAARSQVSWAGSDAPVFERFYAGGFQSMRGFEFRGVGPADPLTGFKLGGDFMWLNSLEYQIPIRANDSLYWVFFVDSGTVERNVDIRDYRVSAGFGLRIVIPMMGPVPIALDFGFPIVKAPQDNQQVFSFWVGLFR